MDLLVADSEEEDGFGYLPSPDTSGVRDLPLQDGSLFTPPRPRRGGTESSIGNFTSIPPATPVMAPKPRPKPRLVKKKAASSDHCPDVAGTSSSHITDAPISAPRQMNDSIHTAMTASRGFSEFIEDVYSTLDIAERAKMRLRKSQAAKKCIQPPIMVNEVIELTSDEDELALKPTKRQKKERNPVSQPKAAPKPRPKPTLRVKKPPVIPSASPSSEVVNPEPPAQPASSARPPESSIPTIPPSTAPRARDLTPPSSPPVTTGRKRKRVRLSMAGDDDDDTGIVRGTSAGDSPSLKTPPPFFAPSSSSGPTCSGVEALPVEPEESQRSKESDGPRPSKRDPPPKPAITSSPQIGRSPAKPKLTPMTELIRRVNSQPCSPFPNAARTYSPLLKSSRTMLSKIAPLHPHRRTPPPPPPRPPPPKKSKKQLEMEERIEEELSETVDGWSCLADEERKALRKARIDSELGCE